LQIRRNHNLLESLTFFFGQALRETLRFYCPERQAVLEEQAGI